LDKKISKYILLVVVTTLLCVFIIESVLHVIGYDPMSPMDAFSLRVSGELLGEYDEELFWRLKDSKPNFEGGKLRIICLTDSVSVMYAGKGYPDILQADLTKKYSKLKPIVFNGGVPGYTSYQGIKYFKTELLSYKPDFVTVCYGWNDHWQSANGLQDKFQNPYKSMILKKLNTLRSARIIMSLVLKTKQKKYNPVGDEQTMRVSITDYHDYIHTFVDICKKEKIFLILMTAPYLNGPYEWVNIHRKYNSVVRRISLEENIPLIDIVDKFRDQASLFLDPENDPVHYNWEGNKIVAQEIADIISDAIAKLGVQNRQ
jgi:lysophospholipase L1-like esterase